MTFNEFVVAQSDKLSEPLAALIALAEMDLDALPGEDRNVILTLIRAHAVEASLVASDLRAHSRHANGWVTVDLRAPDGDRPRDRKVAA